MTDWVFRRRGVWKRIVVAIYIGLNVAFLMLTKERPGPDNTDWSIWIALRDQPMYDVTVNGVPFLYSPVAGWLMIGVTYIGYWLWFALHLGVLFLLRFDRRLVGLMLVSWGFWVDAIQGNAFVFVFVAAVLAIRGSRSGALISVAWFCLAPRPLQIPLVVWALWQYPDVRLPSLGIAVLLMGLAVGTGEFGTWMGTLMNIDDSVGMKIGSVYLFGSWWVAIALPFAGWLTWRGRIGAAGLVLTPYLLPQYFLLTLVDTVKSPVRSHGSVVVNIKRQHLLASEASQVRQPTAP